MNNYDHSYEIPTDDDYALNEFWDEFFADDEE